MHLNFNWFVVDVWYNMPYYCYTEVVHMHNSHKNNRIKKSSVNYY